MEELNLLCSCWALVLKVAVVSRGAAVLFLGSRRNNGLELTSLQLSMTEPSANTGPGRGIGDMIIIQHFSTGIDISYGWMARGK